MQKISEWAFANNQLSQAKLPKGCDVPVNAFDSGVEVHRPEGEPSRLFIFDASTGTILKYSINGPKDVVIPSKIDGVTVRHIGEKAFYEEESGRNIYQIQSVKFPEELTSIGAWAFYENLLTHVEFPKNLISIGAWAFADNQLTQVQFPEGLTYIEYAAFTDNQLTEVEIPEACEVHPEAFDRQVIVRRRKGGVQPIPVPNKEDLFADKVISDPVYSWTVTFNIALDPSTVNEQNFFIQDAEGNILTGIEPTLIDGKKVRFVNQKSFEKNKDYYLVIKKGVRGHGNTILAKNVILKFRVE